MRIYDVSEGTLADQIEAPKEGSAATAVDSLVDGDLTPEAREARKSLTLSLLQPEGRRIVGGFLRRDDYEKIEEAFSRLMGDVLLGCLKEFVRQEGGQVVWSIRMGPRGEAVNAVQRAITVAGQPRCILGIGYLFLTFPNERVVVSAEDSSGPDTNAVTLGVRSDTDSAGFFRRWRAYARAHNHLRNQAFFADGEVIERKRAYGWDDILLPEETKRMIRTQVEGFLRNLPSLKALGVKARRGLIFSGPPGTGKTLLGKVLADTLDASFLWVCPRHIQSAASFQEIMSIARFVAPAVIFLEDLDLFAEEREYSASSGLGELMNQLDGAIDNEDLVTIATTNRLDVIEKALRNRPGRFDRIIEFAAMDEPCRRQMLDKLLTHATLAPADLNHLVTATADYTGAQLEELANTLYILATETYPTGVLGSPESGRGSISVDRRLIDAALEELKFERKSRLGFHAA